MPEPGGESPADAGLRGRDLIGIGGILVGAVVVGTLLGIVLDRALGTTPVLTILGVFAGIVAAAAGFWLRVRDAMRS
jgi:F0F1-type ATP synthase assembly protein I